MSSICVALRLRGRTVIAHLSMDGSLWINPTKEDREWLAMPHEGQVIIAHQPREVLDCIENFSVASNECGSVHQIRMAVLHKNPTLYWAYVHSLRSQQPAPYEEGLFADIQIAGNIRGVRVTVYLRGNGSLFFLATQEMQDRLMLERTGLMFLTKDYQESQTWIKENADAFDPGTKIASAYLESMKDV